jgi:hypothetical protein
MTEDGLERERGRVRRAAFLGCYAVVAAGTVGIGEGWLAAGIALLAMTVLVVGGAWLVVEWDARRDGRRRAAGEAPSWPAQLSVVVGRRMGAVMPGRHNKVEDDGELLGRVSLVDGGLVWAPRRADRDRGVGQVFWDRTWTAEVKRIWGPGGQGCLTLTGADGTEVDVWIYRRADLRRTLGLD